ncbi:MAG: hypothetical protein ACI8WB_004542 [Phenylobacterium sp.]|jgi:hypothetical protein
MPAKVMNTPKEERALTGHDVDRLAALTKERSYQMPPGLTREQRKEWAKTTQQQNE